MQPSNLATWGLLVHNVLTQRNDIHLMEGTRWISLEERLVAVSKALADTKAKADEAEHDSKTGEHLRELLNTQIRLLQQLALQLNLRVQQVRQPIGTYIVRVCVCACFHVGLFIVVPRHVHALVCEFATGCCACVSSRTVCGGSVKLCCRMGSKMVCYCRKVLCVL